MKKGDLVWVDFPAKAAPCHAIVKLIVGEDVLIWVKCMSTLAVMNINELEKVK